MIKKILFLLLIIMALSVNAPVVLAIPKGSGEPCTRGADTCPAGDTCRYDYAGRLTGSHCLNATLGAGEECLSGDPGVSCITGYTCQAHSASRTGYLCQISSTGGTPGGSTSDVFGKITPPPALRTFMGTDPTGARGIGNFVSNLIALIYSIAVIVLVLMLLWGAFDWLTSEGDKEKLENAKKKLINAVVGIMLFAVAFAIIQVLGQFTGFKFFVGQI